MNLEQIAKSYYDACVELKHYKKEIQEIYANGGYDEGGSPIVYRELKEMTEDMNSDKDRENTYSHDRSTRLILYYKNSFKTPEKTILRLLALYDVVRELKAEKGRLTRLLYLRGQSLSKDALEKPE